MTIETKPLSFDKAIALPAELLASKLKRLQGAETYCFTIGKSVVIETNNSP